MALQAAKDGIPVLTPGTDRCASTNPPFAISVIFSPGDYFAGALERSAEGTLRVGTSLTFHMGVDPAPTVKICKPSGDDADTLAKTIADIGTGAINTGTVTGLDDYNGYVPKPGPVAEPRDRGPVDHEAVRRGRRVRPRRSRRRCGARSTACSARTARARRRS